MDPFILLLPSSLFAVYNHATYLYFYVASYKGLVELDVLEQLELETGQKIPELFDWIVATSTGAIIILGLLYGEVSPLPPFPPLSILRPFVPSSLLSSLLPLFISSPIHFSPVVTLFDSIPPSPPYPSHYNSILLPLSFPSFLLTLTLLFTFHPPSLPPSLSPLISAKKSLKEIRQLYYRLKDDVFASPRFGLSYNTAALEGLLIDIFGTEMTLEYDKKNMPKSASCLQ